MPASSASASEAPSRYAAAIRAIASCPCSAMILSIIVVPCAYDSRPPRSPIGNCSVIASNEKSPSPAASCSTIARSPDASWVSDHVAIPSLSQRAGSWKGLSVASWKTMCVISWIMTVSRYACEPASGEFHMKIVRFSG